MYDTDRLATPGNLRFVLPVFRSSEHSLLTMKIVFSKKPKAPPRSLYVIAGEGAAEDGQRNRFHDGCTPLTAIVCVIMVVPALCWISAIWWAAAWTKSEEFKPGLSLEMAVELKRFPDVDLQDACLDLEDQDRYVTLGNCQKKGAEAQASED